MRLADQHCRGSSFCQLRQIFFVRHKTEVALRRSDEVFKVVDQEICVDAIGKLRLSLRRNITDFKWPGAGEETRVSHSGKLFLHLNGLNFNT